MDPQMMLDLCIHNYLIRKRYFNTAGTFSKEVNIHSEAVGIDIPDGFLLEWWSIFWSLYSARFPNAMLQNVSTSQEQDNNIPQLISMTRMLDVNQLPSSSNSSRPQQNFYTNLLLSDAGVDDLTGSELLDQITAEPYCHPPTLADTDAGTNKKETFGVLARNQPTSQGPPPIFSHSQMKKKRRGHSLSADKSDICLRRFVLDPTRRMPNACQPSSKMIEQENSPPISEMAHFLPSSSNYSSPQGNFYTNLLTSDEGLDDLSGSELLDQITAEPYCHPSNSIRPADTEARASNQQQEAVGLIIRNLNSDTPDLRNQLTSSPSPPIFSHALSK